MVKILIYRILGLLKRLGYVKNVYELKYSGKILSLNDLYRQEHWARHKTKKEWKHTFSLLLQDSNLKPMNKFFLIVFYNSRHDPDNLIGVVKVFTDSMKGIYIKDDNKKIFKGISIFPDGTLPNNNLEILVIDRSSNED